LLLAGRFFNLAVIVGVLVWVARKPLRNFYASRTQAIREQLDQAQQARIDAEAKLAEMQSKMSRLDDELRELKAVAERDAQQEYERLVQAAEKDSERIIERARMEIDGMTRAARMELKAHVAELSVGMAEEKIRHEITDEDRSRLFEQFVRKVGGAR
jgi:F-type H+-transporting ATPase subunit b